MSYWVLTADGNVLSRTTVQRVTNLELQTAETIDRCKTFVERIKERLGDPETFLQDGEGKVVPGDWVLDDDNDPDSTRNSRRSLATIPSGRRALSSRQSDVFDNTYLNMELALPKTSGEVAFGRVVKRIKTTCKLVPHTIAQSSTLASTKSNSQMGTERLWQPISLRKTCILKLTLKEIATYSSVT